MKEATVAISAARDIVYYATSYGVEADALCRASGIDPECLQDPNQRLPGPPLEVLWQEVVRRTGDDDFGLHLGEQASVATLGLLGYVMLNCETFGQALEKAQRYLDLFTFGLHVHLDVEGDRAVFEVEIVDHMENYLLRTPRQPLECTLTAVIRFAEQLIGRTLFPSEVWFQHGRPADTTEHERIFRARIHFEQPTNRLVFEVGSLTRPVLSANPVLLEVFEQHAQSIQERLNPKKMHDRVVEALTKQLKGEVPSIEAIARSLVVSVRTLQRTLKREGTTYQRLVDQTRKELAVRHLKTRDAVIYDTAFLLGFSEPSAFLSGVKHLFGLATVISPVLWVVVAPEIASHHALGTGLRCG